MRGATTRLEEQRSQQGWKTPELTYSLVYKLYKTPVLGRPIVSAKQTRSGTRVQHSTQEQVSNKPDSHTSDRQVYSKYTKLVQTVQMYTAHKVYTGTFKQV